MKKIFLLALISLQTTILFGQNNWGSWTTPDCYKGIQFRCKVKDYNSSTKQYTWDVEIKNNYSSKVSLNFDIQNSSIDGRTTINAGAVDKSWTLNSSNSSLYITFSKVCFYHPDGFSQCSEYPSKNYAGYADCDNGTPNYIKAGENNSTQSNNTNVNSTNQTNNTQQQNAEEDKRLMAGTKTYLDYYNRAMDAGKAGKYDDAISLWNSAIAVAVNDDQRNNARAWLAEVQKAKANSNNNQEIANRNAEAQRQQQLLKQQQEQQRQQQLQQGINQVTTATVDLVTYFANRKNALRNSLSREDGQALIDIVNSDNPTNYTQNIIQIFKDLGYTLRETERKDNYVIITLNNDVANINDFMLIFVRPASYDYYNSIGFSYHRKQKLREQLAVLGDKLKGSDGLELQGISASNRQKKLVEDEKKLNEKTKRAKLLIDNFEKNNYWNSTDRSVFSYAKDIAEAYEDENSLNNKSEAIRYYRKAASINLDDLASPWKGDKNMRAYQQKELGKVYFKLAYLLDDDNENNGKEAIIWYLKSSEVDYSKASSNLNIARLYEGGLQGIEKDWNQAKNYYEIAADEKNKKAMNRLGQLYKTGGPNLEQDDSKSKKWFKKASK